MSDAAAPIRKITHGPKFHWFAYYDKLEFDPSGRYVLGMEVDFEGRSPTGDDVIRVGLVDTADGDRWVPLGESRSWGWQQGCMLQWRPGSATEILWNDREGDRFVCHLLDITTRERRTVPHPIYTVAPDGRTAVYPDFRRINDMRPGYGYAGLPDPHADELAPADSGIWRVDLDTGEANLIISLADVVAIPSRLGDLSGAKHYFNHLLWNPDGSRFIFLNRWISPDDGRRRTRMFTANPDGSHLRVIDDFGGVSHFIWRDPENILSWADRPSHGRGFYLFRDDPESEPEPVGAGVMTVDGHCTYLPGGEWIVNDTYPMGRERRQELYLYNVDRRQKVVLGAFHSPSEYVGEWRCDLHPRISPNGKTIAIDSTHEGDGRQLYLIDVSGIV